MCKTELTQGLYLTGLSLVPSLQENPILGVCYQVYPEKGFACDEVNREGSPYLAITTEIHFLLRKKLKNIMHGLVKNVCHALTFLLDNIFIQFGTKLYRQVVGIPMGTNCAPLLADLFQFCYDVSF